MEIFWKICKSDKNFFSYLKSSTNEVGTENICIMENKCSNYMLHYYLNDPIFGGGHDFCIDSDTKNNSDSSSSFVNNYELLYAQTNNFLVGSKYFKVSEIGVFHIIWHFIFRCNTIEVQSKHLRYRYPSYFSIFYKIDCKAFN